MKQCPDPERLRNHELGSDPASCHECAMVASDRMIQTPEFKSWELAQVKSDVDMAGPSKSPLKLTDKARSDLQHLLGDVGWRSITPRELFDEYGLDYSDSFPIEYMEKGDEQWVRWISNNPECILHLEVYHGDVFRSIEIAFGGNE